MHQCWDGRGTAQMVDVIPGHVTTDDCTSTDKHPQMCQVANAAQCGQPTKVLSAA